MEGKRYIREQYRQKSNARIFGMFLTIGINALILLACSFSGMKYIYPPEEEKTLLIDFSADVEPLVKYKAGSEPSADDADPVKPLELVQKSEGPLESKSQNLSKAEAVGTEGDVEMPQPKPEEKIDQLSLFRAPKNTDSDTSATQTAREASDAMKAGHADGNAEKARIQGAPTARVAGRNVVGVPVRPGYSVQEEGTVVVRIWVNRSGAVDRADAGYEGTNVTDRNLWNAARKAAMETKFNVDPEARELQEGTITYIFKLK